MTNPRGAEAAQLRRVRLRAITHQVTADEIKARAREQLAEAGVSGINLRGIGRAMGLTASALYRYFDSRDALVTALVADAYDSLSETMDAALTDARRASFRAQFSAVAHAFRGWALAQRAEFGLIFGTPLPGYSAPPDATRPAAFRTQQLLVAPLDAAHRAGVLTPVPSAAIGDRYREQLQVLAGRRGFDVPPSVVAGYFHAWTVLHGVISLTVFGHLTPGLGDADDLFDTELALLADRLGLPRDDPTTPEPG